jgi:hypothetical protein
MFRVGAAWFIGVESCFAKVMGRLNNVDPQRVNMVIPKRDLEWIWDSLLMYFGVTIVTGIGPARIPVTMKLLKNLEFLYKNDQPTWIGMRESITSLKACYEAELNSMIFFGLSDTGYYENPTQGWDEVIERFGCGDDIEEASKCLALQRYTASVFHTMKVVERGVLEMQLFLEGPDPKASFGGVLSRLEDMVQKTKFEHIPADLKPFIPFMRNILPRLHAVKDAWRDKVAHVDNKIIPVEPFTPEKAVEVYIASLNLMKIMASGLPKSRG